MFLRSSDLIKIKNDDKNCFSWSFLAKTLSCNNDHSNRVSNYKHYFDKLNVESFHIYNGFRCCDVEKFEKLNNLSTNIFELNFYQDKIKWKHNLIPIEKSKKDSNRVVELSIYKVFYAHIKKLNVFSGDHHKKFICRRCLNSHTSEKMLMIHKPKCENYDLTTMSTSSDSHFRWKSPFQKNPFYFRIYAYFEADNEIYNSKTGSKTTNI